MDELKKIVRVVKKLDPDAPHDTLLVLDATTGQNAHRQVETSRRWSTSPGPIVTKLDGTAKGGVVVALAEAYRLPVHAIGVGEGIDDLRPFEARPFAGRCSASTRAEGKAGGCRATSWKPSWAASCWSSPIAFFGWAYGRSNVGDPGGYTLAARFDRVDGLANGADVRVSGIKVGKVLSATLDPRPTGPRSASA